MSTGKIEYDGTSGPSAPLSSRRFGTSIGLPYFVYSWSTVKESMFGIWNRMLLGCRSKRGGFLSLNAMIE